MSKVRAILLRPLDGEPIGSVATFDKADFDRLKRRGAVKAAPVTKKAAAPANKKAAEPANKAR